jgi:hypothetical protein
MFKNCIKCFLILLAISVISCAKRGTITGGSKDTLAPILRSSVPKNSTVNFKGNQIKLYFNEYVKLKNVAKQLIVSPPMKNQPEILPYNASKFITIKWRDTLLPNTTYSFNFGESIEDNNEGNALPQFKYVFSTGSFIDSLALKATFKDALEKKSPNFVSIMLYEVNDKFNDSTIYKEAPRYLTNSLDSLKILQLENLKQGKYQLIALKDENKNNKFDPKKDKIGFIQNHITLPNDTLYQLELFKEVLPFKVFKPTQASVNRAIVGYEGAIKDVRYDVKKGGETLPFMVTKLPKKDSLQIWFPPIKNDSIAITVSQYKTNTNFVLKLKDQKKDTLNLSAERAGNIPFREKFTLNATTPLVIIDDSKMRLINKDSLAITFKTSYDEWKQQLVFDFEKQPLEKYSLTILPGALKDYYDQTNDTLKFNFTTLNTTDFGNLRVILENVKRFPVLVELTDDAGKVLANYYSEKETTIDFNLVEPKRFTMRLIYDDDKNGVWTPGNYMQKQLSEEVIYFPKEIDVRANWDVEQPFDVGKN